MKIQEILGFSSSLDQIEVNYITDDSRKVAPGALFLAYKGACGDGKKYLAEAIKRGAAAVLIDAPQDLAVAMQSLVIPNLRALVPSLGERFYHHPLDNVDLYAVTGTNGKTSVTYYLAQLLSALKVPCGVIGTTGFGALNNLSALNNTTPGALMLREILAKMRDCNIKSVAMEVSSHSLVQERIAGLKFKAAIFTNLTQDHLDYHHTMENYAKSKFKLFKDYEAKYLIINADDKWGKRLIEEFKDDSRLVTFSTKDSRATLFASKVKFNLTNIAATLTFKGQQVEITLPLIGEFNLANALAALAVLAAEGYSLKTLASLTSHLNAVTGRMELVINDRAKARLIVVDYAHTPDALAKALAALRPYLTTKGNLWVVFGCGGDRDQTKRPLMGEVAAKGADKIVITSDNPRSEAPLEIIKDIARGITEAGQQKVIIEVDRAKAINLALKEASSEDIVLVAGKGHETYQIIGDKVLPFSDQQVIKNF